MRMEVGNMAKFSALGLWLLVAWLSLWLLPALAEEEEASRQFENVKTRQRQAVGQACAVRLEKIQKVFQEDGSPDTPQLRALVGELNGLTEKVCASSYEKSQVYNLLGYSHYSLEDYRRAIESYQAMIDEPEADERQRTSTRYTVAQLYFSLEKYAESARQLELWQSEATVVSPEGRALLARAYYYLGRKTEALQLVSAVVDEVLAAGKLPREDWWSLQRVLYYERQEYLKVVSILKQLVTHYPRTSYWQQLGGIYGQLERSGDQLAVTDLLRLQKQLKGERQWLSLTYLYLGADVPFRAARVLEEGMETGDVAKNAKNLETLGTAWLRARENQRALSVLQQAAGLSDSGAIAARLASVYLDEDDNEAAVRAARDALRKGGLSRPGLTRMTLGAALANLQCYREAEPVFREAAEDKTLSKSAEQWLRYVTGEGARRERLIESGATIPGCRLG